MLLLYSLRVSPLFFFAGEGFFLLASESTTTLAMHYWELERIMHALSDWREFTTDSGKSRKIANRMSNIERMRILRGFEELECV